MKTQDCLFRQDQIFRGPILPTGMHSLKYRSIHPIKAVIKRRKSIIVIALFCLLLVLYRESEAIRSLPNIGHLFFDEKHALDYHMERGKVSPKRFARRIKTLVIEDGTEKMKFEYEVFTSLNEPNQARISPATNISTKDILRKEHFDMFHVVTNFFPFDHADIRKNLLLHFRIPPTDQQIEARMSEVLNCLQNNLNHRFIAFVHVLVWREESVKYLQCLDLENSQKLIIHRNKESPTMMAQLTYASEHLQGKSVIIIHQDNCIGEGWEKVNYTVLQTQRLMYALTRHPSPKCNETALKAHCGDGYPYVGSHDAFVLHVTGPFPQEQLAEINVSPNMYGMENVLIWLFQQKLGYKVLNPCKVLKVYHSHCVSIREIGRKRVNVGGKNGTASFTDQLQ